jgi:hypothetical protein
MGAQGSTTLDFGSTDIHEATVDVTGQSSIASATNLAEAYLTLDPTSDHPTDEILMDPPDIWAGPIVDGVGFTIYGQIREGVTTGTFKVGWVWN